MNQQKSSTTETITKISENERFIYFYAPQDYCVSVGDEAAMKTSLVIKANTFFTVDKDNRNPTDDDTVYVELGSFVGFVFSSCRDAKYLGLTQISGVVILHQASDKETAAETGGVLETKMIAEVIQ